MKKQLLETLLSAKLIQKPVENSQYLSENTNLDEVDSPWYIKIILAFSGWLAAAFLMGIFATFFFPLFINYHLLFIFGSALVIFAFVVLKMKKNEFLEHLALATSLAGQVLIIAGFDKAFDFNLDFKDEAIVWFCISLLQLLLLVIPSYVHRVFSSFVAAIAFGIALYYFKGNSLALYLYGSFLMLLTALVWLNEFQFPKHIEKLQAIGYGLVFALIALTGTKLAMHHAPSFRFGRVYHEEYEWFEAWMGELLLSTVLLFVVWKILRKVKPALSKTTSILALLATLLIAVISTQAYGLVIGIMVLLLGFSASNRVLLGLGIVLLLAFTSHYYYFLELTLLQKSITLLVVGVLMISIRFALLKLYPNDVSATARQI